MVIGETSTFIYSVHSVRSAMRSYIVKIGFEAKNTSSTSPPGLRMSYICSINLLYTIINPKEKKVTSENLRVGKVMTYLWSLIQCRQ